ncbi:MAG TPA: YicC/YloC family endoribonuclease [Candidatus Binatia bacterium]|jgi:uncharacterized protein (TIGR00255 family)
MKSMTGYGEASLNIRGTKITVQIRSLNHRHLDLQLRVPREYLSFEEEIRKSIREKISRGRIDLFVNRYAPKLQTRKLEMDGALVGQYVAGMKQLKKKYHLAGEVGVALLANLPELFHVREVEVDHHGERETLLRTLQAALRKLERAREREGAQLRADMDGQIAHIKRIAAALGELSVENGLRAQRTPGSEGQVISKDPAELATTILKGDINEEIVRLKTHVAALAKVTRECEPVGKKIDFMLQEVNRELNTISSKVPNLSVIQLVLQGKERVEKIREQTQNIE